MHSACGVGKVLGYLEVSVKMSQEGQLTFTSPHNMAQLIML